MGDDDQIGVQDPDLLRRGHMRIRDPQGYRSGGIIHAARVRVKLLPLR